MNDRAIQFRTMLVLDGELDVFPRLDLGTSHTKGNWLEDPEHDFTHSKGQDEAKQQGERSEHNLLTALRSILVGTSRLIDTELNMGWLHPIGWE